MTLLLSGKREILYVRDRKILDIGDLKTLEVGDRVADKRSSDQKKRYNSDQNIHDDQKSDDPQQSGSALFLSVPGFCAVDSAGAGDRCGASAAARARGRSGFGSGAGGAVSIVLVGACA